jgi:uncharacterized glyoxalase superfamily protein PhnB
MAAPVPHRPAFISSVIYQDSRAALAWLRDTFGFEVSEVLTDSKGNIAHAEMTHADGVVMIANEWTDWAKSPASVGGKNTQRIHVRLAKDIDKHCEHARKSGAFILMEPADQFYGDRTYSARDPEGHYWTFSQTVKYVTKDDMEKASGLTFKPF